MQGIVGWLTGWSLILGLAVAAQAEGTIRFGAMPYLNSLELVERFTPVLQYLEKRLEQPIKMEIPPNFRILIDQLGKNELDFVFFGPVPYLRLLEEYGAKPILAMEELGGKRSYHGVVFVRQESSIQKLADLAGKRFAFGDPDSTMNHSLPKMMLFHAGVPLKDLAEFKFVGNNQNVVLSVLMGNHDAAGVKEDVYEKYAPRGLRVIARSPPVPNLLFVAGSHMPREWVERMQQAMTTLHQTPEGMAALKKYNPDITSLVTAQDGDFSSLREFMKESKIPVQPAQVSVPFQPEINPLHQP
ncbi:MAG: phosphate/phosphite/phosphonate ABC transporter substrate-binding protein [Magnetococcales bacterium]|nr:phosphate/phosphite/phosphonate ABC transporter substrate-binding protein [Magnetococcales bacterium]